MIYRSLIASLFIALPVFAFISETVSIAQAIDLDQLRQRAVELVNNERRERGLGPLSLGSALNSAAQTHAEDMLQRNYYSHVSPEGDTVADRYIEAGGSRWHVSAENIARCQGCPFPPGPERVVDLHRGWMDSPPHRENIVKRGLDRFGFGIAAGPDQALYAVQAFAGPGTPREMQPGETAVMVKPEEQTVQALQRLNKERHANGSEPLKADPTLIRAASNLIQQGSQETSTLDLQNNLSNVVPAGSFSDWRSLAAVTGRCGGCGTQPTAADVRSFVNQWLEPSGYRDQLLSEDLTHLGFALQANGDGLKTASAVLGQHR
jgi:uncharacterized protein YkwD